MPLLPAISDCFCGQGFSKGFSVKEKVIFHAAMERIRLAGSVIESLAIAFLVALKMYWARGLAIYAMPGANHDEGLFLRQAESLIGGHWLGQYDQYTLIKGPFYGMWVAFSYSAHIPLIKSHHLLYAGACVLAVVALAPLIRSRLARVCVFSALWFNPVALGVTSVLRDAIYSSLTLICFACCVAIVIRAHAKKSLLGWFLALGLAFSALWLTREEGVWLLPLLLVSGFACYVRGIEAIRFFKYALAFLFVFVGAISSVKLLNYLFFNTWAVVEVAERPFVDAYQSLIRVKSSHWHPEIPVPSEARQRIYLFSPSFAELKPFLEGERDQGWRAIGPNQVFAQGFYEKALSRAARERLFIDLNIAEAAPDSWAIALGLLQKKYDEGWLSRLRFYSVFGSPQFTEELLMKHDSPLDFRGGWFLWAFRDAVEAAGYYKDPVSTRQFFERISREVDEACRSGRLVCAAPGSGLMPPLRADYVRPLLSIFSRSIWFVASLEGRFLSARSSGAFDHATATVSRENLVLPRLGIKGWIALENKDVRLSVERPDSKLADAEVVIKSGGGDGVVGENGTLAKTGSHFSVTTNCLEGCALVVRSSSDELVARWSIHYPLVKAEGDDGKAGIYSVGFLSPSNAVGFAEASSRWRDLLVIERIERVYVVIFPWLVGIGLLLVLGRLAWQRAWRADLVLFVCGLAWLSIVCRLFIFSLISATSFPAINWQYLGCLVPLLIISSLLPLLDFVRDALDRHRSS